MGSKERIQQKFSESESQMSRDVGIGVSQNCLETRFDWSCDGRNLSRTSTRQRGEDSRLDGGASGRSDDGRTLLKSMPILSQNSSAVFVLAIVARLMGSTITLESEKGFKWMQSHKFVELT